MRHARPQVTHVAPGVIRLRLGRGLTEVNVAFVGSERGWVLVDTGWAHQATSVRAAAADLFGRARPTGIVLTHFHPDHSGGALALLRAWQVPLWVHPDEVPFARGGYDPVHAHPLDRRLVGPLLRLMPAEQVEAARIRNSLEGLAQAYDPAAPLPGLPDWHSIATPGHTPGHAAYLRPSDGILLSGDALLSINTNALPDLIRGRHGVFGPPGITTWDTARADRSLQTLLQLEASVIVTGHGPVLRRSADRRTSGNPD